VLSLRTSWVRMASPSCSSGAPRWSRATRPRSARSTTPAWSPSPGAHRP